MRRLAWLLLLSGCFQTNTVTCGDVLCPGGKVCAPDQSGCVLQDQLDVCAQAVEGAGCMYPGTADGVCHHDVCIPAGCGNGVLEPGELCDDGNRVSLDGCRSDCESLEICGDGVSEPALGEQCDCGNAAHLSATCSGPNSSDPGATCRPDCTLARCGDGVLDPGEQCDDGNTKNGDGCRADCQGRFAEMQTPTGQQLWAVDAIAADDVYAVGDGGTVIHFDGTEWSAIDVGAGAGEVLDVVWGSSATDVYVASGDLVIHYDGVAWTPVTVGDIEDDFTAIWGSSATDVYLMTDYAGGGAKAIYHFDGLTWTTVDFSACSFVDTMLVIWGTGSSDVYVAGYDGVCRYNGATWTSIDTPMTLSLTGAAMAVDSLSNTFGETIRHWNGTTWTSSIVPGGLGEIVATSSTELLGIGSEGLIMVRDAGTWTHLVSPTDLELNSVSATSPSDVFIVGDAGTVLH